MPPPPEVPKSLKHSNLPSASDFKGFTPPPMSSSPQSDTRSLPSDSFLTLHPTPSAPKSRDYDSTDYSRFASSVRESPGYLDSKYAALSSSSTFLDQYFTQHPRARNCWESVKTGAKMGSWVGAIFGGLTGLYAAALHRSILLLPVSMIGGGVSFGFFLGCGMLVRCDKPTQSNAKTNLTPPHVICGPL